MLNTEKIKLISNSLQAFDFGRVQELNSMIVHLETFNITIDEFKEWLKYEIKNRIVNEQKLKEKYAEIICPDCNEYMKIFSVNENDYEMVGGDYKSQLVCPNWNCGYEEFSKRTFQEWKDKYDESDISLEKD